MPKKKQFNNSQCLSLSYDKSIKRVISSNIGCQMTTVKNVMSVVKSSTLFVVGIIAVFVARYSATGVVIWRFQG